MTSPTQVALRELVMLTRCYCEGQRDGLGHPHPQLGNNCSFRPDVETLMRNIGAALKLCDTVTGPGELPADAVWEFSKAIRRALLGLPWNNGNATPDVSDGEGSPSGPG